MSNARNRRNSEEESMYFRWAADWATERFVAEEARARSLEAKAQVATGASLAVSAFVFQGFRATIREDAMIGTLAILGVISAAACLLFAMQAQVIQESSDLELKAQHLGDDVLELDVGCRYHGVAEHVATAAESYRQQLRGKARAAYRAQVACSVSIVFYWVVVLLSVGW